MSDPVVARPANEQDLAAIVDLATHARKESVGDRGGHLLFDLTHEFVGDADRYRSLVDSADRAMFVGEVEGISVGFATAHLDQGSAEVICAIDELFVHPRARAVGVGAALLTQVQEWARTQNCTYVESQVLPGNRAAKNFFERVGMVTRSMRVSAPLEPQ